jgi:hypothetical protein
MKNRYSDHSPKHFVKYFDAAFSNHRIAAFFI